MQNLSEICFHKYKIKKPRDKKRLFKAKIIIKKCVGFNTHVEVKYRTTRAQIMGWVKKSTLLYGFYIVLEAVPC